MLNFAVPGLDNVVHHLLVIHVHHFIELLEVIAWELLIGAKSLSPSWTCLLSTIIHFHLVARLPLWVLAVAALKSTGVMICRHLLSFIDHHWTLLSVVIVLKLGFILLLMVYVVAGLTHLISALETKWLIIHLSELLLRLSNAEVFLFWHLRWLL